MAGMRKQVSFFLPVAQWVLIRNEAIRLGIPITELVRRWMSVEMRRLEKMDHGARGDTARIKSSA